MLSLTESSINCCEKEKKSDFCFLITCVLYKLQFTSFRQFSLFHHYVFRYFEWFCFVTDANTSLQGVNKVIQ